MFGWHEITVITVQSRSLHEVVQIEVKGGYGIQTRLLHKDNLVGGGVTPKYLLGDQSMGV